MSGPKVSVYDLTSEQRAIIAAERQRRIRELEKRQELLKELLALSQKTEALKKEVMSYTIVAQEESLHLSTSRLSNQIEQVCSSIRVVEEQITTSTSSQDNNIIEQAIANATNRIWQIEVENNAVVKEASEITNTLQAVLSSDVSKLFVQQEVSAPASTGYAEDPAEQQSVLLQLAECKHLPVNLRAQVEQLLSRVPEILPDSISSFYAVEVQPVIKECGRFNDLWSKHGAEYEQLLARYEILANENRRTKLAVVPFTDTAIAELTRLIAAEEAALQEQAEQTYIADTIASVMEEMGYDICGRRAVARHNGSHYSSNLFQYGEDAVINVVYSDDGRITMEVGKTDTRDRMPEGYESQALVSKMEEFCDDFIEIERKLAEKGVALKSRIRLSPPSVEFAQIINTNDYTPQTTVINPETKRIRQTTKRKKHLPEAD